MAEAKWICSEEKKRWVDRTRELKRGEADLELDISDSSLQFVEGFGGCFNEMGWSLLEALDEGKQQEILHLLFDKKTGCGLHRCRVPIGASDYALDWYSHNETPNDLAMDHFSILRDKQGLIPFIRAAREINSDITLFASPWSPPSWMKESPIYNGSSLRWTDEVRKAYALYFARFVQAYHAEGMPLRSVMPQNEPDSEQRFPSCIWTGEKLRDFIRDDLKPIFEELRIDADIWLGTIERAEYDAWVGPTLTDPKARDAISGIGFQWAGKGNIQRAQQSASGLKLMQTEVECGDGKNTWDYAHYVFGLLHHYFINGVTAFSWWNMVLAPGGKSTWGWPQNSPITVDADAGTYKLEPDFYVLRHAAAFVPYGSHRLACRGAWAAQALAFRRPDGSVAVVTANPYREPKKVRFLLGDDSLVATLPARSFNTVVVA